jgi:hypothetical protein
MTAATRSIGPRLTAVVAATLAAGATLATAAGPASANTASATTASASSRLHATYKVTGSTYIKAPNFTLSLGPGKLSSTLNTSTGNLTASLSMPNATGSFKQFGLVPVTSTTQFINDGPTTGRVNLLSGKVRTTSKITLRIVSLTVAGLPIPVGSSCQTTDPVVVRLASQPGFNLLGGGKVAGRYTIGDFSNCGLATLLINQTIPGAGNTITLKLGKAKVG